VSRHEHGILVAVDESGASDRALRYVANMVGERSDVRIHLLHLLRPVPPAYREHGGSEDPDEERRLCEELRVQQENWIEKQATKEGPILARARSILVEAGVPETGIEISSSPSFGTIDVGPDCLTAARDGECETIVVGRTSLPWFRELFRHHHCHDLVKRARGFTVWVVE